MSKVLFALLAVAGMAVPAFADDAAPDDGKYGKMEGVAGPVLFGPKLTLVGAPVPFRFGLEAKWNNLIGLGFDYGFFPTLTFSSVSVGLKGWNVTAKWYPWKRAFYVGAGLGGQTFTGSKTDTSINDTLTIDMKTTFFMPGIGWRWTSESGFFWGMELAAQIPMSNTATTSHSNAAVAATAAALQLQTDVNDKAQTFGNKTLPTVALLQFGYFF